MIEVLEALLGDVNGTVLQHYIDKSETAIKNYCGIDDISEHETAVIDLAVYYYRNKDMQGYSQVTQGNRSFSVASNSQDIPASIKAALPKPKIKALG